MNKARRKIIAVSLADLKKALTDLKSIYDEETTSLDRIPENDDNAERKEAVAELLGSIDDAMNCLREAIDTLEGADL